MKSAAIARTTRPVKGQVAFARAAAMGSLGTRSVAAHPLVRTGCPQLDRDEDPLHPGEEGA